MKKQRFRPDWASAPGDTIADLLRERGLTVEEFARRMACTPEAADALLNGQVPITLGMARQLSHVIGSSVEFWMSRDYHYREDSARINDEWMSALPVRDMVRFGWLEGEDSSSQQVSAFLRFFGVPSVTAWREQYGPVQEMVAFRTSKAFPSQPAAVAAWLRQGQIEAASVECAPWDPQRFRVSLSSIRVLTRRKNPRQFLGELVRLCAQCGVATVVVRAPSGCRASGATQFLSRDKALMLLSFRYLTDDQFWFTVFHESAHLLLHGERLFLEGLDQELTKEEIEANDFAARTLVPPEAHSSMLALPVDAREVIRFAVRLGISPGIVVGQLQHLKRLRHNQLNALKRRYEWGVEASS